MTIPGPAFQECTGQKDLTGLTEYKGLVGICCMKARFTVKTLKVVSRKSGQYTHVL